MSAAEMPAGSLRAGRAESSRLAWAFVLSLSLHFAVYGTFTLGKRLHWWESVHLPAWLQKPRVLAAILDNKPKAVPTPPDEAPLMFVEVNPEQATTEAPKTAKFYSNKNAIAANPQADKNAEIPKIAGTQKQVVKTEDVPREKFTPLQPSRPPAPAVQDKVAREEMKPKPAYTPGDLTMAKPETTLRKEDGQEARSRPRTLEEAKARQHLNRIFGEKMTEDGGVARRREFASLDTKATPFGDYDAELVEAISARWYELLDRRDYASDSRGKVVLQFNLSYDGRITDLNIEEKTVNDVLGIICEKAVRDPSPYKPWPMELRRLQGDMRHVQFTFYYN
jgi:hypothetical protein